MQVVTRMLLLINRKFKFGKLKSSHLSLSFVLNRHSTSILKCRSKQEADLAVSVVSFISSSVGQMRSTKSPNLELFTEKTSFIQRNVKLKDRASFFSFFLRTPVGSLLRTNKATSWREEERSLYPQVCRLSVEKHMCCQSKTQAFC